MAHMNYTYTRRRYGHTTYTWVSVLYQGVQISLGDPWPCVTPRRQELATAAAAAIARYEQTRTGGDSENGVSL